VQAIFVRESWKNNFQAKFERSSFNRLLKRKTVQWVTLCLPAGQCTCLPHQEDNSVPVLENATAAFRELQATQAKVNTLSTYCERSLVYSHTWLFPESP